MNPRNKFLNTINGENSDVPIFCPAIYNYKAKFSGIPPHLFGQNEHELIDAVTNEVNHLQAELITVGYDIYNIEAEALGARVERNKADIFPEITAPLFNDLSEVDELPILKKPAGRMPVYINATKKLSQKYQDQVYVRGAVSGPFSLAGALYQNDRLITECIMDRQGVYKLLKLCTKNIITYIDGFIDEGQDVVVFDSLASPPMVSPEIYSDLIHPFHQQIFEHMINRGVQIRPLILGGNTLSVIDQLTKTGANQLLLDYNIPLEEVKNMLDQYNMAFRINFDPGMVAHSNLDQIQSRLEETIKFLGHFPNLLIGTGILPIDTPLQNIQFIRNYIIKFYGQQ